MRSGRQTFPGLARKSRFFFFFFTFFPPPPPGRSGPYFAGGGREDGGNGPPACPPTAKAQASEPALTAKKNFPHNTRTAHPARREVDGAPPRRSAARGQQQAKAHAKPSYVEEGIGGGHLVPSCVRYGDLFL
jgi:hypothetical protein